MSELVEKVAEAIYKVAANHGPPDSWRAFTFESPEAASIFRDEARAAIEAMQAHRPAYIVEAGALGGPLKITPGDIMRIPAEPQWQPIETAPKDGIILLYVPNGLGDEPLVRQGEWHHTALVEQGWLLHHGPDLYARWHPTHWQPLPPPPPKEGEEL